MGGIPNILGDAIYPRIFCMGIQYGDTKYPVRSVPAPIYGFNH